MTHSWMKITKWMKFIRGHVSTPRELNGSKLSSVNLPLLRFFSITFFAPTCYGGGLSPLRQRVVGVLESQPPNHRSPPIKLERNLS